MCEQCNYSEMLRSADIDPSANRLHILEVIGENNYPLTAAEIYQRVEMTHPVNRVTVYRVLDLLVNKSIVERLSAGGRSARFGMAPNENHARHPHFYCTRCGQMDCLSPESIGVTIENLQKTFPGKVERIEIRVDGICRSCLEKETAPERKKE